MATTLNTLLQDGFTMSSYQKDGYETFKNLVDAKTIKTISQYFENKIRLGEWKECLEESTRKPSRYEYYGDPLIEVMLVECLPLVEEKTGLELEPTYSFSRIYQSGEELEPHIDRPSCEVSVTVNVACTGDVWPIWMQYKDNDPVKCMLNPGDAVIYKGCETTHWRRKLPNNCLNVQFMLHYIDKNGKNGVYKFDERGSLGFPAPIRSN
jgi:hypothetical protein